MGLGCRECYLGNFNLHFKNNSYEMPCEQNHTEKLRSRYFMPLTQFPTTYEDLPNQLHHQAVPRTHPPPTTPTTSPHTPPTSPHTPASPHTTSTHTHHLHIPNTSTHTHLPQHPQPFHILHYLLTPTPPYAHHVSPYTTTFLHPTSFHSYLSSFPSPPSLPTITFSYLHLPQHTCKDHKLGPQRSHLFCRSKFYS